MPRRNLLARGTANELDEQENVREFRHSRLDAKLLHSYRPTKEVEEGKDLGDMAVTSAYDPNLVALVRNKMTNAPSLRASSSSTPGRYGVAFSSGNVPRPAS